MYIDSQRLHYKICPIDQRYSRKVQENLAASNGTFSDLQTPGWSSLMKSQISEKTKRTENGKDAEGLRQMNIYNKLNQADKLKWSESDQNKMVRNKPTVDKNDTRDTDRARHLSFGGKFASNSKQKLPQKTKRWNQITVHQYLYQNSKKLENKKMANKILDEQFKKQQIYRFTPLINKKSIILAESKFSRAKQIEDDIKKQQNTVHTEATQAKQKDDKDVQRYRLLNKVFYYLSEQKTLLTQESLQRTLQKLPLPCIKTLQPIITSIYQGSQLEWLDFLEQFNDKKNNGKESFYAILMKWFQRIERCQKCVGKT